MNSVVSTSSGWTLAPQTTPLRTDRVRIAVAMAGLCRTDIQAMTKKYPLPNGTVLGHEAAGTVVSIPDELDQHARSLGVCVGQRVAFYPFYPCGACDACSNNEGMEYCHQPAVMGVDEPGAFSTFVDVPLNVIVAGGDLSWKHLAYAEPVAASMAVANIPELQSGEVAVVGQGRIAALTLTVLNSARSTPADLIAPDCVFPKQYDAIVETWPTQSTLHFAAQALKVGGLLVVKSRPAEGIVWPHKLIALKRLRVVGAPYGSFKQGIEWMQSGKLNVDHMLGPVFPFDIHGIEQALAIEARGGETDGKLFFAIDGGLNF